jgi:hypothetical protein
LLLKVVDCNQHYGGNVTVALQRSDAGGLQQNLPSAVSPWSRKKRVGDALGPYPVADCHYLSEFTGRSRQ